jgi:hypothetical protein
MLAGAAMLMLEPLLYVPVNEPKVVIDPPSKLGREADMVGAPGGIMFEPPKDGRDCMLGVAEGGLGGGEEPGGGMANGEPAAS